MSSNHLRNSGNGENISDHARLEENNDVSSNNASNKGVVDTSSIKPSYTKTTSSDNKNSLLSKTSRMIVETETVATPSTNLLPINNNNMGVNNTNNSSNGNNSSNNNNNNNNANNSINNNNNNSNENENINNSNSNNNNNIGIPSSAAIAANNIINGNAGGNPVMTNSTTDNHSLLLNNTVKENVDDDSNETFVYDNNSSTNQQIQQVQLQQQSQLAQAQAQLQQAAQMQPHNTINSTNSNGSINNPSSTGNTLSSPTMQTQLQANNNPNTLYKSGSIRKPRFNARNGSINSVVAQGAPSNITSIYTDNSNEQQQSLLDVHHNNGICVDCNNPNTGVVGENSNLIADGTASSNTATAPTDYVMGNNRHGNNLSIDKSVNYSDNDIEDDDFETSTYDSRSQLSNTNKGNGSPRFVKHGMNHYKSLKRFPKNTGTGNDNLKNKQYNSLPANQQKAKAQLNNTNNTVTNSNTSDEIPPLRAITSKLFDSKGTQPRRYSFLPENIDFDDFDDDDFDEFDFNNQVRNNNINNTDDPNGNEEIPFDNDQFKSLRSGRKNAYGSINDGRNDFASSYLGNHGSYSVAGTGGGLKKFKRNNDLYFSPHNFPNSKNQKLKQFKNFMITFILILLLLGSGFISGFLLASTKDLQAVRILQVRDVIISEEEFVFNLVFEGFNPGFFSIEIQDVELDIFAKSSHAKDEDYYKISTEEDEGYSFASNGVIDMQEQDDGQLQTVLLGNIRHFEVPLKFQGGFFTRQKVVVVSEVKIIHPCSDDDDDDNGPATSTSTSPTTTTTTTVNLNPTSTGSENHPPNPPFKDPNNRFGINKGKTKKPPKGGEKKWVKLSQYPFDLIVRGVLKYNLPILKEYKSLAVNKIVTIDPDNLR